MSRFIELANSVNKRGNIVPVDFLQGHDPTGDEWYRSVYQYDDEVNNYIKENNGKITGYDGKVYPEFIPIDIDQKSDVDALEGVKGLLMELDDLGVSRESRKIYFSGHGFHVLLSKLLFGFKPSEDLPQVVKATITNMFDGIDFSIYDKTRIFRLPNSINKKTGLYKIRLTEHEIFNLTHDEIIELARKPRAKDEPFDIDIEPVLAKYVVRSKPKLVVPANGMVKPKKFHCIHRMLESNPEKGTRNQIMMRIASHFKRNGYSPKLVKAILTDWLGVHYGEGQGQISNQELENIIKYTYEKGYTYGCDDPVMKEWCDSDCIFFKNVMTMNSEQMASSLFKFVTTDHPTFSLNWLLRKEGVTYEAIPGNVIQVVADSGVGKSIFAQNWVLNQKVPTLYVSLEMSVQQTYRRFIQARYGLTKNEAFKKIIEDPTFGMEELSHIYLVTKKVTVEGIERLVDAMEADPLVIVIDHILLMDSNRSDEYQKIAELTGEFKQYALSKDKIIVSLSQISKGEARAGTLGLHSAKGNSSLEQDADSLILLQRADPKSSNLRVFTAKEREGQYFDVLTRFNVKTMQIMV